jgi:hypothetical protein
MFVLLILTFSLLLVVFLSASHKWMALPLVLGYVFRVVLMFGEFLGYWVVPGNGSDSVVFEQYAVSMSHMRWGQLMAAFDPGQSYVYSWIGAVVFKVFGYHELTLPLLNLVAGILVVFFSGRLSSELWDRRAGRWAAMVVALFPFAAFNSVIVLREEFSIFFFALGLLCLVRWSKGKSPLGMVFTLACFSIATVFHGGWLAAIIGLAGFTFFGAVSSFFRGARSRKIHRSDMRVIVISLLVLVPSLMVAPSMGIKLSKGISLDAINMAFVSETLDSGFDGSSGGSAYPAFIAQGDPVKKPWLVPGKVLYFLFSPFPWDIHAARHLAGISASLLFFWLFWRIWKNRRQIRGRRELAMIAATAGAVIFVFAIGTSNIGTSIRHRTKVLVALSALAAGAQSRRRKEGGQMSIALGRYQIGSVE